MFLFILAATDILENSSAFPSKENVQKMQMQNMSHIQTTTTHIYTVYMLYACCLYTLFCLFLMLSLHMSIMLLSASPTKNTMSRCLVGGLILEDCSQTLLQ